MGRIGATELIIIYWFVSLLISAGLGFIPAYMAKNKGHSFGLWWFYGWMLFIVAIIHVNFIPDNNAQQNPTNATPNVQYSQPTNVVHSAADELKKFKELKDQGIITEEEFQAKKEQLLKLI